MTSLNEINSKADILLERLRSLADGKTSVNLFDEINHAALDIIASVCFKFYFYVRKNCLTSTHILNTLFLFLIKFLSASFKLFTFYCFKSR